ncbi:hypothetical protein CR155_13840 [Pollutimonas nitritireducens]|uniref:Uncharacterized protein n=1 Tax=Pollutimonas nitritireducens TaxID=2045209 RepID=A0A2N4UEA2_9BURK|nr:hypothetical protein CR155_13840 [Pollutimonas nitritireducens]
MSTPQWMAAMMLRRRQASDIFVIIRFKNCPDFRVRTQAVLTVDKNAVKVKMIGVYSNTAGKKRLLR